MEACFPELYEEILAHEKYELMPGGTHGDFGGLLQIKSSVRRGLRMRSVADAAPDTLEFLKLGLRKMADDMKATT